MIGNMRLEKWMFAMTLPIILMASVPSAFGQTTNIISVSYPPKTTGPVNITANVSYAGGDWLVAALVQLPPPVQPVNSDVNGTPIHCNATISREVEGLCAVLTEGKSGLETVRWSFFVLPAYQANFTYGIESFVANSSYVEYKDSYRHQQFTILVTPQIVFTGTTQIQMTTQTYGTSTTEITSSAPLIIAAMFASLVVINFRRTRKG